MTRTDVFSSQERDALKEEIKHELRRESTRKRMMSCAVLFVLFMLLVGGPIIFVSTQFAKTGFVDIPLLSKAYYRSTVPTRTVLPLFGSKPDDIYRVLGTRVRFEPATSLATVSVTEAEITTLVQHSIASAPAGTLPFQVRTAQVAVDPTTVEIYAISPQKNRDATVRIRFRPSVKGGELRTDVQEIAIGSLILPKPVGEFLFSVFGKIVTESVSDAVGNIGTLANLKLEEGNMVFVLTPNIR